MSGSNVCLAEGSLVVVLDVSDPKNMVEAAALNIPGATLDMDIVGRYVLVAARDGLCVIDIWNAREPSEVGFLDTPAKALSVALAGNLVYIAEDTAGFRVVDVTDPSEPKVVGSYKTAGACKELVVKDTLAYAVGGSGLEVFDVSVPDEATKVGWLRTVAGSGLDVWKNWAYLSTVGLTVVDVSNPAAPVTVGNIRILRHFRDVVAESSVVYMGSRSGLHILDVSRPEDPQQVGFFEAPSPVPSAIAVRGDTAYVAGGKSVHFVDIANRSAPREIGRWDGPGGYLDIFSLSLDRHVMYVAGGLAGLLIVDISDPLHPTDAGAIGLEGHALDVAVRNGFAYVAAAEAGLHIVDVSRVKRPRISGWWATSGDVLDVQKVGRYLYLACNHSGVRILDAFDPEHPIQIGAVDTPGQAVALVDAHDTLLVADGHAGLQLVDVSHPEAPKVISNCRMPRGEAVDVVSIGSFAFVAADYGGLQVVDFSNANEPRIVGCLNTPDLDRLAVLDSGMLVARMSGVFGVLDVSNPSAPRVLGSYKPSDRYYRVRDIQVSGDYAFAAVKQYGLQVVDVSVPAKPREVARLQIGRGQAIDVEGAQVFIIDDEGKVYCVDVAVPERPHVLARYDLGCPGEAVCAENGYVYVASGPSGLHVLRAGVEVSAAPAHRCQSRNFYLLRNYPNPFNSRTHIVYRLASPANVLLGMYNAEGRRVRVLVQRKQLAGEYHVVWDGRNDVGSSVASGVYMCRLRVGHYSRAFKLLLLR